ncbi:hypothetical protein [Rhodohalobacter sp. 8-1]|uniref:hypothetical protein n=1 Tax=Rhodohalobacter sp. 8-1 TaxID=3131972 RepID=UPI0030EB518B
MHFLNKLSRFTLGTIILLSLLFTSCSTGSAGHWSDLVPADAPFLIVPEQNQSITDLLDRPFIPQLDDLTPSAMQLTGSINQAAAEQTHVEAVVLYTDQSNQWQPVWIIRYMPGIMATLKDQYQSEFAQNRYTFRGYTIERLQISDREIYIVSSGDYLIFSESSLGVENSLRAVLEQEKRMDLSDENIQPGSFIANTESLPNWIMQLADISYRPFLYDTFRGGEPIHFKLDDAPADSASWRLTGQLSLEDDPSALLRSLTSSPQEFTLDRYIPNNAAAFSILRLEPRAVPQNGTDPENETDRYLTENSDIWSAIASSLSEEIAFVSFAESGSESTSEYLFLRHLSSASDLRTQLNQLTTLSGVTRDGNTYIVTSRLLGSLIGSELNSMRDFYLHIHRDVAILAQRRGLAESVPGDANRRRVMYYNDDYMMVRDNLNENLSSLTYVNTDRFETYIQPWLFPQNNFGSLISNLDLLVISSTREAPESTTLSIQSFQREVTDEPYRERWIFPIAGADITGQPVLADITSNARNEVIFTTSAGSVFALATDGTEVLQVSTQDKTPIGQPIVYDWYGNNQNVILQAAGNSIFAWNANGSLLPNFPITLDEEITTPLTIEDVTRTGIAEIIVATADRSLHILNSRGEALSGWPQEVNAVISSRPSIMAFGTDRIVFAATENTIHAWNTEGEIRNGFPLFMETSVYGVPLLYKNHLLSAGRNGNLYSIGSTPLFADSLSSITRDDSLVVQRLQVSSGSLNTKPQIENILLRNEDGFFREDLIILQNSNGSVFMYNLAGILRFTKSMGQPSSDNFPPAVLDINKDQRMDIVALADFGRIYAWEILTEQRLYDLPTTGMSYPLISDLYGDGNNEIIAHTREGIRCWTILETRTESEQASED